MHSFKSGFELKEEHIIEKTKAQEKQNKVLERIDYCSTVLPAEYDFLLTHPHFHAKYFPFQYVRRSDSNISQVEELGNDILVGNSADWSNNHFDIIDLIKHRGIDNTLYFSAAYGDNKCRETLVDYLHRHMMKKNI